MADQLHLRVPSSALAACGHIVPSADRTDHIEAVTCRTCLTSRAGRLAAAKHQVATCVVCSTSYRLGPWLALRRVGDEGGPLGWDLEVRLCGCGLRLTATNTHLEHLKVALGYGG